MIDPRHAIVAERMRNIKHIIAVCSSKGGVGKSLISCLLALVAAGNGHSAGLLDLDFQGASDHLFLGSDLDFPAEDRGIIPVETHGIRFMTAAYYAKNKPLALRGQEVTDAFLELLAVTLWQDLDFLFIDTPPGIGDEMLDLLHFLPDVKILLISSPHHVALHVVHRLAEFLQERSQTVLGYVINNTAPLNPHQMALSHLELLGELPFAAELDEVVGHPEKMLKTILAAGTSKIFSRIVNKIAI